MGKYKKILIFLLLFNTYLCNANQIAIDKLREATLIQFGVDKAIKQTTTFVQSQLKIQNHVKYGTAIVKVVREKRISFIYQEKNISITTNSIEVTCHF